MCCTWLVAQLAGVSRGGLLGCWLPQLCFVGDPPSGGRLSSPPGPTRVAVAVVVVGWGGGVKGQATLARGSSGQARHQSQPVKQQEGSHLSVQSVLEAEA